MHVCNCSLIYELFIAPSIADVNFRFLSFFSLQTTEIEVRIRETHDDAGVVGLHGIVRSVSGSLCSVFVRDEDKTVSPAARHLAKRL